MIIAETPNLSSVLTLNLKCSILPPVSPSTMMGFVVTSNISSIVENREEKSTNSVSGFPLAVESVRLLSQIPSNSIFCPFFSILIFSTIKPVSPLCASKIRTTGFTLINRRNVFIRFPGVIPCALTALIKSVDEIPSVYFGSTSSPSHSARISITRCRTSF